MKQLPIGIQDFPTLIEAGYLYVDKTEQMYQMLRQSGTAYFLSRPRRFGKTLLVSSLAALFSGKRHLFKGTWIDQSDYDWQEHPVLSLDFSFVSAESKEDLLASLNRYLGDVAKQAGAEIEVRPTPAETLRVLIEAMHTQGSVVLLVDEYDKPRLKHLHDYERTESLRNALHEVFSVVKALQSKLRFVLITGVSKFSKVSIFSGMNHLKDISLHPDYATLLGLTEQELKQDLDSPIVSIATSKDLSKQEILEQMRAWYNGYLFSRSAASERVFNPWSVLNYLDTGIRDNYWFSSGTPSFAINMIRQREFPIAQFEEGIEVSSLSDSCIQRFQEAGYLTIASYNHATGNTRFRIPNEEVRQSLRCLLGHQSKSMTGRKSRDD